MEIILITLGFAVLLSPITLLIGLYKVIFQKEDKAFGIKLLTYSTIVIIIGLGTCASMMNGYI
jgi:hypothetical protein